MIERIFFIFLGFFIGIIADYAFFQKEKIEHCKKTAEYTVSALEECTGILLHSIEVAELFSESSAALADQNRQLLIRRNSQ